MKMQTSVSRDGIVANKGEILGKVRFAVASYRQLSAQHRGCFAGKRCRGGVKINRVREATRLRGYEATKLQGLSG